MVRETSDAEVTGVWEVITRGSQKHRGAFGYQSKLECKLAGGSQAPY